MNTFIESLNWRVAVKKFDPSRKLAEEQVEMLVEAARLAPSSAGLQPWRLIVVTNPEIREKLREAAFGQSQVTDASHLFVFAAQSDLSDGSVDHFISHVSKVREVPVEALEGYSGMLKGLVGSQGTQEGKTHWAALQAYIGLGFTAAAAAVSRIDACPMGGFDPKRFDEILGLGEKGLASKAVLAVGYRASDDTVAAMKKVRFPKDEFVIEVN